MKLFKQPLSRIILLFLAVEIVLMVWVWIVRQRLPDFYPENAVTMYRGITRETNPWLEPWQRWDTPQYQAIAERGFSAFDTAYFTPPIYPWLMKWFSPLFGGNTLASGLFISAISFLGCLYSLHSLSRAEGFDEERSFKGIVYFAVYPAAFFLVAAYNESLFLMEVLLCFLFIRREKWVLAGIFAALATLTRIPGFFLILPLGYACWKSWRTNSRRSLFAPVVMAVLLAIYYIYQWVWMNQSPLAILKAQNIRGGYLTWPGLNLLEAVRRILQGQLVVENGIEFIFSLFFIILVILVWKKLPRTYGIFAVSLMVFFLARMGSPQPLVSMVRYTMEIFPVFLIFSQWGQNRKVHRLILYASLVGLLFLSGQFAIWGWVG